MHTRTDAQTRNMPITMGRTPGLACITRLFAGERFVPTFHAFDELTA